VSLLYGDVPFLERPAQAALAGFDAVECLFPYTIDAQKLAGETNRCGLEVALINAPAGNWDAGERGIAALSGREVEYRDSVEMAKEYAIILKCSRVHVMAGLEQDGATFGTFVENLRFAVEIMTGIGIEVLVEPLNQLTYPGYLLSSIAQAEQIISELEFGVRLQADAYHLAMMGLDPRAEIATAFNLVGHVQIAGPPERWQPTADRIDAFGLFADLDLRGYGGWVGCEYHPRTSTQEGLGWAEGYLSSRAESNGL
jgi:2-dehydrotetronate isomerase